MRDIRQGPRSGGTAFVLLHHLVGAPPGSVRGRGWWRDGPDAFTDAAEARGANGAASAIRTGAAVARIQVKDDAVAGVVLASGEEIAAPIVLSTADPARTLLELVDPVWLDPEFLHAVRNIKLPRLHRVRALRARRAARVPGLAAPRRARRRRVAHAEPRRRSSGPPTPRSTAGSRSDPHVEITVPSLRWPRLAPDGKHVLVARAQYAPVPAARRRDLGRSALACTRRLA